MWLLEVPAPTLLASFPGTHARVLLPWWIIQQEVPADNHLSEGHVHVDHQYVAVVDDPEPVRAAAHPFAWYGSYEFDGLRMSMTPDFWPKVSFLPSTPSLGADGTLALADPGMHLMDWLSRMPWASASAWSSRSCMDQGLADRHRVQAVALQNEVTFP